MRNIEYHKIIPQVLSSVSGDDLLQIIHQISFHTINNFEEILSVRRLSLFLTPFLLCLPKELTGSLKAGAFVKIKGVATLDNHAMVRDGNRSMSPFVSPLYNILCLGHTVKITHLGVTVQ